MNYGRIVEDSFSIAWKNKTLWIFGLFAGSGGNFNLDIGSEELSQSNPMDIESLQSIWHILLPIIWALLVMGLIFFVLHLICSPALVDGVNKIARGGTYKFWESYSRGIDFFWRKLGLTLVTIAAFIAVAVAAILPLVVLNLFGILLLIPIALFGIFTVISIFSVAERVMVVRDSSIGDAIEEAYFLLKKHFGKFVLIALIFIGLSVGIFVVVGTLALMLYFPVNALVKNISENLSVMIILGIILGLPISLVIGGFFGTFFHSMYTLFYFGLVDPATPYASVTPNPTAPQPTQ